MPLAQKVNILIFTGMLVATLVYCLVMMAKSKKAE